MSASDQSGHYEGTVIGVTDNWFPLGEHSSSISATNEMYFRTHEQGYSDVTLAEIKVRKKDA